MVDRPPLLEEPFAQTLSGKNYGKSLFSMGKSTISMVMFNSYDSLPEGMDRLKKNVYRMAVHVSTIHIYST